MNKFYKKSHLGHFALILILCTGFVSCSSKKSDQASSITPDQPKERPISLPEEAKLVTSGSYLPEQSAMSTPLLTWTAMASADQCLSYFQQLAPELQKEFAHYEYQNSFYDRLRETNDLWRTLLNQALDSNAADRASKLLQDANLDQYKELYLLAKNEFRLGSTIDLINAYLQRLRVYATSCSAESKEKIYQIKIENDETLIGSIILSCERDQTTVQDILGLNLKVTESDWLHLEFSPYGDGQQALGLFSLERPYRKNLLGRLDQIRNLQFAPEQYGMSAIQLGLDRSELTPGFYLFGLNLHLTPKEIIDDFYPMMSIDDAFYGANNTEILRKTWKENTSPSSRAIFYQSPFVVKDSRGVINFSLTMQAQRNFVYSQLMPQDCYNKLKYDFWEQLSADQQQLVNNVYRAPNFVTDLMEDGSLVVRDLKPQFLQFKQLEAVKEQLRYFNGLQRQTLFKIDY